MWRIYYSDGSTFDHTQGEPHEAPAEGVLCIVALDRHGRRYIASGHAADGRDERLPGRYAQFFRYDRDSGEWWPMDMPGLFDALRRNVVYAFKEGRSVDNEIFQAVLTRAHNDPDFSMR
jgi:hypothetical protein